MKRPTDFRIYRNLHRRDWTLQRYVKGQGWRKVNSFQRVAAPSVTFVVSDAGRERARQERRKNVHAFAYVPYLTSAIVNPVYGEDAEITYTPYDDRGFRAGGVSNVTSAVAAIFEEDGLIYARRTGGGTTD